MWVEMFGKLYYKTVAYQSTVQATHNFKQLLQTNYPPEKKLTILQVT